MWSTPSSPFSIHLPYSQSEAAQTGTVGGEAGERGTRGREAGYGGLEVVM